MSALVDQLQNEHKALLDLLTEVKSLGISKPEAQEKMMSAKSALLAHLKKEDEELYPKLHLASTDNTTLKGTLDMFAKDMEGLSAAALGFFDKYQNGGDEMAFAGDFGKLSIALSNRIRREEEKLYPEFAKL